MVWKALPLSRALRFRSRWPRPEHQRSRHTCGRLLLVSSSVWKYDSFCLICGPSGQELTPKLASMRPCAAAHLSPKPMPNVIGTKTVSVLEYDPTRPLLVRYYAPTVRVRRRVEIELRVMVRRMPFRRISVPPSCALSLTPYASSIVRATLRWPEREHGPIRSRM